MASNQGQGNTVDDATKRLIEDLHRDIHDPTGEYHQMYAHDIQRFGNLALVFGFVAGFTLILTGLSDELASAGDIWSVSWRNLVLIVGGAAVAFLVPVQWGLSIWRQGRSGTMEDPVVSQLRGLEAEVMKDIEDISRDVPPASAAILKVLRYMVGMRVDLVKIQREQVRHLFVALFVTLGASGVAMLAQGIDASSLGTSASGLVLIFGAFYIGLRAIWK